MTTTVLVLGEGTGGLVAANLLAKEAAQRNAPLRIKLIGRLAVLVPPTRIRRRWCFGIPA